MSAGNVFAKGDKMELAIELDVPAALRNKQCRVISVTVFLVDCAKQQISLGCCRKLHNELVSFLIFKDGTRHRTFRPNQQIGRWICAQRDCAQSRKFIEDFVAKLSIDFLSLWN